MNKKKIIDLIKNKPYKIGQLVGFDKLSVLHNEWLKQIIFGKQDLTLLAHRESYKTTVVSIALALIMVLRPNKRIIFIRKSDNGVKEILKQVKAILLTQVFQSISAILWDCSISFTTDNDLEVRTNLCSDIIGTPQLIGIGIGGSITGKHSDYIFTDDIVTLKDRTSRAERDRTKGIYFELQNIRKDGGRIINTGTTWHKDDCISIMPNKCYYPYTITNILTKEKIDNLKETLPPSIFSANYELRHIASEDVLFSNPQFFNDKSMLYYCMAHIDAGYGGEDYTAWTYITLKDNIFYVLGKIKRTHVDNILPKYLEIKKELLGGKTYVESNADKGYLKKNLKEYGDVVKSYHESTNKHIKITSYIYRNWNNIRFHEDTDKEYLDMICDYSEGAEHDDAPDSLASALRVIKPKIDYVDVF